MKPHIIIDIVPDVPTEVSRPLLRILRTCEIYIPFWVQTLVLQYVTSAEAVSAAGSSFAQIITNPPYYTATLRILPRWLDETDAQRRKSILHEIGHMHHADAYHVARQIAEQFAPTPEMRNYLLDRLRDEFEKSAEGFALMILGLEGKM